jgi:hypothetical protein
MVMKPKVVAAVFLTIAGLLASPAFSQSGCKQSVTDVVWLHSYEQDREGTQVFRPRSFPFPRTRGPRDGILLRKDGTFVRYGMGRDDAGSSERGIWRWIDKGTFELKYSSEKGGRLIFNILSCTADQLVVRVAQPTG